MWHHQLDLVSVTSTGFLKIMVYSTHQWSMLRLEMVCVRSQDFDEVLIRGSS